MSGRVPEGRDTVVSINRSAHTSLMFSLHSARYHAGCLMQSWGRGLELGMKVGQGLTSFPGL